MPDKAKAQSAIEKAKAAAAARANMSPEEKLAAEITALKARVEKARVRLEKACSAGDANIEAFETALKNLQNKLDDKMREQQKLTGGDH
ncbi:hypothetical protein [Microbulbifer taiwanensis]|uniref:hypothetical protein n=1 Tax=Microbulbifer taiwanensis TaxID=986746 RepID=UPI003670C3CD